MSTSPTGSSVQADRQWFIVGRWQEYGGEGRANLLRIVAVAVFYAIELVNFQWLQAVSLDFHRAVTALAVAWTMVALGVLLCLRRQLFPPALKYISTLCDLVLLTSMAALGGGPASPLVFVYFPLLALAALRFQLRLVWCATAGSMVGYVVLLGLGHPDWFGSADAPRTVPRVEQLVVLVSLLLTGVILGQVIRRSRNLADEFAQRLQAVGGSPSHRTS